MAHPDEVYVLYRRAFTADGRPHDQFVLSSSERRLLKPHAERLNGQRSAADIAAGVLYFITDKPIRLI